MSCYFLAKERGWGLLTNDGALRKSGQQSKLEVRGVLWILDELEAHALLSSIPLADALESMLKAGGRLPRCLPPPAVSLECVMIAYKK